MINTVGLEVVLLINEGLREADFPKVMVEDSTKGLMALLMGMEEGEESRGSISENGVFTLPDME